MGEPPYACPGIQDSCGDRLPYFVGQRGSQFSQHADAVDMRQVRFQLVQSCFLVFGKLALGHVYGCADYLNDVACAVQHGTTDTFKMLQRAVGHTNPVFEKAFYFLSTALEGALSDPLTIVRVDPLHKHLEARQTVAWLQPVNTEYLLGAVQHPVGARIPRPATRARQPLRFGQISLAAPPLLVLYFEIAHLFI